ncbi:golgin subfamily A member 6B-like isoform X2 [Macaca nemestrina]|uniref:golgin subfamily A member 6B-like isoform X2 n=1 Tax=Macaca nemestrina TaxID=9545 RepID=UPI0039B9520F
MKARGEAAKAGEEMHTLPEPQARQAAGQATVRLQGPEHENKSTLQLEQQVKELQEKLSKVKEMEHLEAANQWNQQLETQLSLMALPGQGDGGGHLDSEEEGVPRPMPSVPEDLESREATFPGGAGTAMWAAEGVKAVLPAPGSPGGLGLEGARGEAPASGTVFEFVCGESYRALREAMEKVKSGFMDLRKEKVDRMEQVENLKLGFIQLSGATDGMREYITIYGSQGAVPNTWHQEMEDIIRLDQNEEEMKVNLLELQKLLLTLVGDHEGHDKFLPAAHNPADEPAPGAPAPQEIGAAEEQPDFYEVSVVDSVEPAPGEAREGSPCDNPTSQKIVQLLPVTQDTQEHPGLASKPCMPFFYWAAENREINIIIT